MIALAIALVLANVGQPYPEIAPLQHVPTVVLLLAAPPLLRRWPLSDGSVACVLAFLLLHTLAGRYTYSNVPYDAWMRALTGLSIDRTFGVVRNDFDRLVHFAFGLLAIRPYAEAARRYGGMHARAALVSAFLFVGTVGALYEIFEWLLTMALAPDMADQYNGQQGDMWDSQKDMAIAMLGGLIASAWLLRRHERGAKWR
jgi:putative membrane protein